MFTNLSRQAFRNVQKISLAFKPAAQFERKVANFRLGTRKHNDLGLGIDSFVGQNRFFNEGIKPVDFESKYAEKLKAVAKKYDLYEQVQNSYIDFFSSYREGLTVDQLKQKIKEEAKQKLKAATPKKVEPKVVKDTTKKASASTIAAKSQLPYDSSAPVSRTAKK